MKGNGKTLGQVTTMSDGSVRVRLYPGRTTSYTATFDGDADHLASTSTATTVKVTTALSASVTKSGSRYIVKGVTNPGTAGTKLLLQVRHAKAWKTVDVERTGKGGKATFKVKLTKRQSHTLRVSAAGGGVSNTFTVRSA